MRPPRRALACAAAAVLVAALVTVAPVNAGLCALPPSLLFPALAAAIRAAAPLLPRPTYSHTSTCVMTLRDPRPRRNARARRVRVVPSVARRECPRFLRRRGTRRRRVAPTVTGLGVWVCDVRRVAPFSAGATCWPSATACAAAGCATACVNDTKACPGSHGASFVCEPAPLSLRRAPCSKSRALSTTVQSPSEGRR